MLAVLLLSGSGELSAQNKKGGKKSAPAAKGKKQGSSSSGPLFYWPEIYAGYMSQLNSGDYLEYQKQYYYTENPDFSISGEFPQQYSPLFGASFHVGMPVRNPVIKFVSAGLSSSWSQRSLGHQVNFTNRALPYNNKITINELYSAAYLGTEFQLRFGSKVYGLLGLRNEHLLSGFRERTQTLEGDSVQSGKALVMTSKWNLKDQALVRQNAWGWHAALGYSPFPYFGLRIGMLSSGSFFTAGPDFSSRQMYLALCFGIVK